METPDEMEKIGFCNVCSNTFVLPEGIHWQLMCDFCYNNFEKYEFI